MEDFEELIRIGNLMIELGTKIKEQANKDYMKKNENELTKDELKDYQEFLGYYVYTQSQINK